MKSLITKQKTLESREVAKMTGKVHSHLLRDIKGYKDILDQNPNLDSANFFIASTYTNENNQSYPCYLLTRKGCDMVANKMTGEKGILFTAEYVTRFEEMEKTLNPGINNLQTIALMHAEVGELIAATVDMDGRITNLEQVMTIDYSQQEEIRSKVAQKVVESLGGMDAPAYKELNKKAFSQMWKDYKRVMQVNSYRNTAVKDYEKAEQFIEAWKPSRELELMILGSNSQMRM